MSELKRCPDCGRATVEPSRPRHLQETLINLFPFVHYYRCHYCNWRGKLFSFHATGGVPVHNHAAIFTFILIVIALLTLYVRLEMVR